MPSLRALLTLSMPVAVVVLAVLDRHAVASGVHSVLAARPGWLLVGLLGLVAMWVAGTLTQLGVLAVRPPLSLLFAVQVAGSFANSVLPAGAGGLAVNVRFLRRLGLSREAACASQALNTSAGAVTHLLLVAVVAALAPHRLLEEAATRLAGSTRALEPWAAPAVVATAAVVGLGAWLSAHHEHRWLAAARVGTRAMLAEHRALHRVVRDPVRALQLWPAAMSVPVLHSLVLFAVLRSIGAPLPMRTVLLTYLLVSALSAIVPSPGGAGSLDVALVAGLAAAGLSVDSAVAALAAYRFLTVWLPLVPGACVLGVLVRRGVV
ncbi:uncharacterized membrane protein YbhN (UPF0104 family) [Motilibacter peucedani]|uniref:Uncharacterized membrane protein YbhN (UPF0104 family) n=1 Tax=Motilibacter peucedani TaxID=598650 RepID=A0A420XKN2_9ACTN|nr:uncharacterized membrane protein YbhN (UPF0104 family) [Motilibacter peucedani]